jgi:hypothetical protein
VLQAQSRDQASRPRLTAGGIGRLFNGPSPDNLESQPDRHHFPLPVGHHPETYMIDVNGTWKRIFRTSRDDFFEFTVAHLG